MRVQDLPGALGMNAIEEPMSEWPSELAPHNLPHALSGQLPAESTRIKRALSWVVFGFCAGSGWWLAFRVLNQIAGMPL